MEHGEGGESCAWEGEQIPKLSPRVTNPFWSNAIGNGSFAMERRWSSAKTEDSKLCT